MTPLIRLSTYSLEIEWLLTWFPIRTDSALSEYRTSAGVFLHRTTDARFLEGNREMHLLGEDKAAAFIDVGTDQDDYFTVNLEVRLGTIVRRKTLLLRSDTTTPYMVNVDARGDEDGVHGTALSLYGVITTGRRPNLLTIVSRVLGP